KFDTAQTVRQIYLLEAPVSVFVAHLTDPFRGANGTPQANASFMKNSISSGRRWISQSMALLALGALTVAAQDSATKAPETAPNGQATVQLSSGAFDVFKLVRAQLSENTILAFIASMVFSLS